MTRITFKVEYTSKDRNKDLRRAARDQEVEGMRSGVVQRAHTFKPKKGKGSYDRRSNVIPLRQRDEDA